MKSLDRLVQELLRTDDVDANADADADAARARLWARIQRSLERHAEPPPPVVKERRRLS